MSQELSRRGFLQETALLGAAVATMRTTDCIAADTAPAQLPKIRLGNLEVGRLILGSNPFFGYAHQGGDVGAKMQAYYTDEHIMAVMDEAAALGVTAVAGPPLPRWINLYAKYLDRGGKLRTWIAQPHGSPKKMKEEITLCDKAGAKAIFVQGHKCEDAFVAGQFEMVRGWMEHIKSLGLPAGMGSHNPATHLAAEKAGFPTDFYFQCFFRVDRHPEDYSLECRDKAVETIRAITKKPVVAYKILGAARLEPVAAFEYAFQHITAKDGVCVGIYNKDKPSMVGDDVAMVCKYSKS